MFWTAEEEEVCMILEHQTDRSFLMQGFKLLYLYQKAHPDFSLEQYLSGRSPQFQVSILPFLLMLQILAKRCVVRLVESMNSHWQEHVHKNLAKVHAQAETGQSMSESSSSVSMPLQV